MTLAWATTGTGPPLVRTANWLTHLEHDWQTPIWRPFLERLSRTSRLVRYDQRGCGLSDRDVDDFSFDASLRDLEAVVDAAGLERFALLGISQGAAVATAYAARHPERVRRLVLYGSFARGQLLREPAGRQREEVDAMLRVIRVGWGRRSHAYRQLFASLFLPDATLEQLRAFSELQRLSTSAANAERIVEEFSTLDVRDVAPLVNVPTLVLHVRDDARVPVEEGRRLAALIPGAEFMAVEGRNHVLLPGDAAFDEVGNAIERFLGVGHAVPDGVSTLPASLTRRELDVLELVAAGLDNGAIATRLFISEKTVRNHITRIFAKLSVTRRAEAIVRARDAGLGTRHTADA